MADRVERLPFTVYDIMGYLVPGLYTSIYVARFFECADLSVFASPITVITVGVIFLFIIEAYVFGHVIAFVSAETIERLCVAFFGYPSKTIALDRNDDEEIYNYCKTELKLFFDTSCFGKFIKGILLLLLLPHTALLFVMSKTIFSRVAIKPLGEDVKEKLYENFSKVFENTSGTFEKNSHRYLMIDHYVQRLDDRVAAKQYNYVTLYGFCRNMSFAAYCVFWFDVVAYFFGTVCFDKQQDGIVNDAIFNISVSVLLMLAFLKFFRRYTEQALMAFATLTNAEIKQRQK